MTGTLGYQQSLLTGLLTEWERERAMQCPRQSEPSLTMVDACRRVSMAHNLAGTYRSGLSVCLRRWRHVAFRLCRCGIEGEMSHLARLEETARPQRASEATALSCTCLLHMFGARDAMWKLLSSRPGSGHVFL